MLSCILVTIFFNLRKKLLCPFRAAIDKSLCIHFVKGAFIYTYILAALACNFVAMNFRLIVDFIYSGFMTAQNFSFANFVIPPEFRLTCCTLNYQHSIRFDESNSNIILILKQTENNVRNLSRRCSGKIFCIFHIKNSPHLKQHLQLLIVLSISTKNCFVIQKIKLQ